MMRFQANSNLRFIPFGVAAILSVALHVGIVQLRLPVPPSPTPPQVKTPPLTIPQQSVQIRSLPKSRSLESSNAEPTPIPLGAKPQTPPSLQSVTTPPVPRDSAPAPRDSASTVEPSVQVAAATRQRETSPQSPQNPPQDPKPDPTSGQSLAQQWDSLVARIQAGESDFGQAQSLQDILTLYGLDNQFDLFFDSAEQPKVNVLSYQLFTDLTPDQVWTEKVLPSLEQQDFEITEDQRFAEGKVYRISQGTFFRYLNVVPLFQPNEVVLLEMAEAPPFKEN